MCLIQDGLTPLQLAKEKGLSEIVHLLKTGVPAQPGEWGREGGAHEWEGVGETLSEERVAGEQMMSMYYTPNHYADSYNIGAAAVTLALCYDGLHALTHEGSYLIQVLGRTERDKFQLYYIIAQVELI